MNNNSFDDIKKLFYNTVFVWGKNDRLHLENKKIERANTLFNTRSGHIYVGKDTMFGHNCMVLTGKHVFFEGKRASLSGKPEVLEEGNDIKIGCGCWISSGSIILGGVTIGDNSIIGAGSVVTKDVPPNCFYAGNPAKFVKNISDKG